MIRRKCSGEKRKYRSGVIVFAFTLAVGLSGCGNPEVKSALREAELALERAQASSQRNPQQQVQEETQQTQESSQKQEDSEEAGTGTEEKTPGAEKSPAEMTAAEKMQFLTIEGVPLPIPCKVGDLDDRFSLGTGLAWDDYYTVQFFCQGKEIGRIYIEGLDMKNASWKDGLIDMSSGYEDGTITGLTIQHGSYELPGISSSSTRAEIIALWGETDWDKKSVTSYEDYRVNNEPDSGTHITFYWNKADKIDKIMIIYEGSY